MALRYTALAEWMFSASLFAWSVNVLNGERSLIGVLSRTLAWSDSKWVAFERLRIQRVKTGAY